MVKKNKFYNLWIEYDKFICSLHLENWRKETVEYSRKKRFFNYLKRLPIIFFGSLLTTLTFQFFINRNKLFNSGLSGIIQVITNYLFVKNRTSEQNRVVSYYIVTVITNILIVALVQFFYPYNFEVNSTAIFYVLFQLIWSKIFSYFSLQNYFFNHFSAQSWSNLSPLNQLGLTLPFYITIAVVSAVIHTNGYALIYRAKSTPGGFEILTSTLAQSKKNKVSIGYLNKLFSLFAIFFITVFNFLFVNDNIELKTNSLIDLINSKIDIFTENQEKIKNKYELSVFLEKTNVNNDNSIDSLNLRKILKNWSGDNSFVFKKLPQGIQTYLKTNKEILKELSELRDEQIQKVKKLLSQAKTSDPSDNNTESEYSFLSNVEERINEIKKNTYEKNFLGYFKYVTNDEKLLASLVYIFFSSYLINQIFPKSKTVLLTAILENDENLEKMLDVLQNYNPSYSQILPRKKENQRYLLFCSITKWNYQLLANEINKLGKVLVNKLDE